MEGKGDSIDEHRCLLKVFKYFSQHNIQSSIQKSIRTLDEYIHQQPPHIRHLIQNYELNHNSDSLLELLNNKSMIYISTDGARIDTKSGGGWLITTDTGQRIVHGFNSDYGQSKTYIRIDRKYMRLSHHFSSYTCMQPSTIHL